MRIWLSVKEVAALESCSERNIRVAVQAGKYKTRQVPAPGGYRYEIHRDSLSDAARLKLHQAETPAALPAGPPPDWPEWKTEKALANYEIVQAAFAISGRNKTVRLKLLADQHDITLPTLYNLLKRYKQSGFDGLAPDYGKTRNQPTSMSTELQEFIRADYLRPEQPFKYHVYQDVQAWCEHHRVDLPSYRTVCRFLSSLDAADVTLYRVGVKAYKDRFEPIARRDFDDLAPNEIWCLDHREFDLFVYTSDERKTFKRPWISAQMDLRTRALVGWHISFQPNSLTAALGLRHGILNYGKPDQLYLDNGKDYRSRYLNGQTKKIGKIDLNPATKGVFARLGIRPRFAWPYSGRSKPIEPFFNNFGKQFERYLPGWCGRDNKSRPEKLKAEISNGELLTIDEFRHLVVQYLDKYNNSEHSEIGCSPNEAYRGAMITKVDPESLVLMMLKIEQRTYQNDGIHLYDARYRSEELNRLVKVGTKVDIYYDPDDLSQISVFRDNQFLCNVASEDRLTMNASEEDFKRMARLRKDARAQIKKERQNWTFVYSKEAAMKEVKKFRQKQNPEQPLETPAQSRPGKVVALFGDQYKKMTAEIEKQSNEKSEPLLLMKNYKEEPRKKDKPILLFGNK